ncbi:MAG: hypothetical protein O3C57_02230, partial [Verrucomicrobia bacterium]|nr:hypothetical protein [Verrucomicrobiota bacterium]
GHELDVDADVPSDRSDSVLTDNLSRIPPSSGAGDRQEHAQLRARPEAEKKRQNIREDSKASRVDAISASDAGAYESMLSDHRPGAKTEDIAAENVAPEPATTAAEKIKASRLSQTAIQEDAPPEKAGWDNSRSLNAQGKRELSTVTALEAPAAHIDEEVQIRASAGEKRLELGGEIWSPSESHRDADKLSNGASREAPAASAPVNQVIIADQTESAAQSKVPPVSPTSEPATRRAAPGPNESGKGALAIEDPLASKNAPAHLFDAPVGAARNTLMAAPTTELNESSAVPAKYDQEMLRLIGSDKNASSLSVRAKFTDIEKIIAAFSKRANEHAQRQKDTAQLAGAASRESGDATTTPPKSEIPANREQPRAMRIFAILGDDYDAFMKALEQVGMVTLHTPRPESRRGGFFKRLATPQITIYLMVEPPESATAPAIPTP